MTLRDRLACGAAMIALTCVGGPVSAAEVHTATGTEGADVSEVVVTAERNAASTAAPSKASLLETQPQSIISHKYIEQATPEAGDYTTVILIAPSISGVSSNGGGVGDTDVSTLRGFGDGFFNITYDGLAFGDANDTTHHPAAFFPSSTIGAAVVDRGPGSAGDLGQANFGGAVHLFSPGVTDAFSASQKLTFGSFNTQSYVTTLQTGAISQLHDAKLLLSFDERSSDTELSGMGGEGFNQMAKLVVPVTNNLTFTGFFSYNYIFYHQDDAGAAMGAGVTADQLKAFGKDFQLNNDPTDEHYTGYNYVGKHTYFSYADVKWDAGQGLTVEDQLYDYYYNNQTVSAQDSSGLTGADSTAVNGETPGDVFGYRKQNQYETFGNVIRVNKDFGIGTLRVGALTESSWAHRFIYNYDFTTGKPDTLFPGATNPPIAPANASYDEQSSWFQYQVFADFQYRPTDKLTITPGIKYMDFTRRIDAIESTSFQFPVKGSREYTTPTYFLTANYRITPNWSIYAQGASAFLVPPVKTLGKYPTAINASTAPEQTITYQIGTVYTAGPVTADVDFYDIHASNILEAEKHSCGGGCYINAGSGYYEGVEAEGAYAFKNGVTLFANGSINEATITNDGSGTNSHSPVPNAPKGTAAVGVIYDKGPWTATLSNKFVGPQVGSDGATNIKSYNTMDASASYDFGKFKLKIAGTNLFDRRALTDFDGSAANSVGYYVFQVGRQIEGTIEAKF